MLSRELTTHLIPARFTEAGAQYLGRFPLASMLRLKQVIENNGAEAIAELDCRLDQSSKPRIYGRVMANIVVLCQRCLQPISLQIDRRFELSVEFDNSPDNAKEISAGEGVEIILLQSETVIETGVMIEDELLLSVPMFPAHENIQDCDQTMIRRATEYEAEETREELNPFAVLKKLKQSE